MIDSTSLQRLFPGTFNFFRRTPEELRLAVPDAASVLPQPQRIFLESEEATPLMGFAVLMSDNSTALREALEGYLQAEIEMQALSLSLSLSSSLSLSLSFQSSSSSSSLLLYSKLMVFDTF